MFWHSRCEFCTVTVHQSLVESLLLDFVSPYNVIIFSKKKNPFFSVKYFTFLVIFFKEKTSLLFLRKKLSFFPTKKNELLRNDWNDFLGKCIGIHFSLRKSEIPSILLTVFLYLIHFSTASVWCQHQFYACSLPAYSLFFISSFSFSQYSCWSYLGNLAAFDWDWATAYYWEFDRDCECTPKLKVQPTGFDCHPKIGYTHLRELIMSNSYVREMFLSRQNKSIASPFGVEDCNWLVLQTENIVLLSQARIWNVLIWLLHLPFPSSFFFGFHLCKENLRYRRNVWRLKEPRDPLSRRQGWFCIWSRLVLAFQIREFVGKKEINLPHHPFQRGEVLAWRLPNFGGDNFQAFYLCLLVTNSHHIMNQLKRLDSKKLLASGTLWPSPGFTLETNLNLACKRNKKRCLNDWAHKLFNTYLWNIAASFKFFRVNLEHHACNSKCTYRYPHIPWFAPIRNLSLCMYQLIFVFTAENMCITVSKKLHSDNRHSLFVSPPFATCNPERDCKYSELNNLNL
ncbi:hypothetical protein VP01_1276g1 [Puccinia sorghi]|uniref:Uncharacterized protein n=1 Tax=Puccinia sorghi TaxID=27349 RepID=A0A0L6VNV9_9BASI|nr:hypothetical protein VP01_1276g1 [Puccinia sorghi]